MWQYEQAETKIRNDPDVQERLFLFLSTMFYLIIERIMLPMKIIPLIRAVSAAMMNSERHWALQLHCPVVEDERASSVSLTVLLVVLATSTSSSSDSSTK